MHVQIWQNIIMSHTSFELDLQYFCPTPIQLIKGIIKVMGCQCFVILISDLDNFLFKLFLLFSSATKLFKICLESLFNILSVESNKLGINIGISRNNILFKALGRNQFENCIECLGACYKLIISDSHLRLNLGKCQVELFIGLSP